jgi:general secretion pathway protein E
MNELITRPHGILLVTGPTGSGKTTTLYACLAKINSPDLNILTIEDPVEYQLDGISQTAVNTKIELTFAAGLRSFLRHDPDVIMVGEIRDRETSEIAIQASLTGHLVLSTIHTNDAAGAITRLVDLGVQPFLVASSLMALLAQRLVRRVCSQCREAYEPSAEDLLSIGIKPEDFLSGKARRVKFKGVDNFPPPGRLYRAREGGCAACLGLGYKGRTAIYELLIIDEKVRQLTIKNADAGTIKSHAMSAGMRTLRDDGAQKVLAGMTTTAEVLMITTQDAE